MLKHTGVLQLSTPSESRAAKPGIPELLAISASRRASQLKNKMCVCTCVCTCVCMYSCAHVCVCVYVCARACKSQTSRRGNYREDLHATVKDMTFKGCDLFPL
jgi:hypothetical protein